MRCWTIIITIFTAALWACTPVQPDTAIDAFSDGQLQRWQEKVFRAPTQYNLADAPAEQNGGHVLQAVSRDSASALYHVADIDLQTTPYVNWSWKIERTLGDLDESVKAGDDYAARLYIVISPEPFQLKPRSLNYVWANTHPAGSRWTSPYAEQIAMLAVRSGNGEAGHWHSEKRNVREDLRELLGEDVRYIEGVALMTDSDDSDGAATAWYGDIYFSSK
jgi:hypothetical protein